MIQIEGLTRYQVEMLDHMWSLKTMEEYQDWLSLLCEEDYVIAVSLSNIVSQEALEHAIDPEFTDAKDVLKKFAL
jgi:hypothetical protein